MDFAYGEYKSVFRKRLVKAWLTLGNHDGWTKLFGG